MRLPSTDGGQIEAIHKCGLDFAEGVEFGAVFCLRLKFINLSITSYLPSSNKTLNNITANPAFI